METKQQQQQPPEQETKCIGDESVLMTVSRIMADKKVCELMNENKKLQDRLQFIKDALEETCGHTYDLVWYARSRPEETMGEIGRQEIRKKYPEEIKKLRNDNSNWQHGFNSGCLATSRLVESILCAEESAKQMNEVTPTTIEDEMEQAILEFPFLDT